MEFGTWVKNIHSDLKLDIRRLADMTGVDASTISRIENLKTEATLYTAFRISQALDFSLTELIHVLSEDDSFSIKEKESETAGTVVTPNDVADFVDGFYLRELEFCERIAKSLNEITIAATTKEMRSLFVVGNFTGKQIYALLIDSPIFQFAIKYPSEMRIDDILFNYRHRGALLLTDITAYLSEWDDKNQTFNIAPIKHISYNALNRLLTSTLERIRLSDVLLIDKELSQNCQLIDMYWEACGFYVRFYSPRIRQKHRHELQQTLLIYNERISIDEHRFELASTYILISRWYQYFKLSWDKMLK